MKSTFRETAHQEDLLLPYIIQPQPNRSSSVTKMEAIILQYIKPKAL